MLKNKKGITLIALIITIIVMLILVGVTINVALNGGLFQKAEYASEQMQVEAEKEELLSAVMGAIGNDGKIKFEEIKLPEGWSKASQKIFKSPKDNIYEVDDYGKITYRGKNTGGGNIPVAFTWESVNLGNVDTSTEYKGYISLLNMTVIVIFTEDGRVLMHTGGGTIEKDAKDEENIDKATGNLKIPIELDEGMSSFLILTMNENNADINFEILGIEKVQCVKQEKTIYTNEELLKALGITNYTGTYNGTWTKVGTENGKTKLISTLNVTQYTLGAEDPKALGSDELQKAMWSYKNVENTLNKVVQETTGITSARSIKLEDIYAIIGEENVDKGTDFGIVYNYYYNAEKQRVYSKYKTGENSWSQPSNTGKLSQIFLDDNGDEVVVDSEGDEVTLTNNKYFYVLSDKQKKDLEYLNLNNTFFYANSYVSCEDFWVAFGICLSHSAEGEALGAGNPIFYSSADVRSETRGVRAVILVPEL